MAKKESHTLLPLTTEIELIAIKGDKVFKKPMTYEEALNVKKIKGWTYINYQKGFSQFNKK